MRYARYAWNRCRSSLLALIGCLVITAVVWSPVLPSPGAPAAPASAAARPAAAAPVRAAPSGLQTPRKGGRLIVAQANDYVVFDPVQVNDNPSLFELLNFYNPLLRPTVDGFGLEGGVSDTWESAEGGRVWLFTIRNGIKFRDGTPVKASDVKWSLDRLRRDTNPWYLNYTQIDGVDALDDAHVRVSLKSPWAPILSALAMFPACIAPQHTYDVAQPDWDQTNGTGPFYIASWDKKQQLVMKANPNYWEPGKPYLDEIEVRFVADDNARLLQLQGGQVDLVLDLPLSQVPILSQNASLVARAYQQQAMVYINLNNTRPPLDNVKVRQALNYATDKAALNQVVYFGLAEVQTSPLPKGTFWDSSLQGYPYDVARAKQLLAEAGYADGFPGEIMSRTGNLVYNQIAQVIQAQWRQIGVDVTINALETGLWRSKRSSMDYFATPTIWTNDMNDPTQVMHTVFDGRASAKASYTGFNDERVNQLIDAAEVEQDQTRRGEIYKQIQQLILDAAPDVFLAYWPEAASHQKFVQGFLIDGLSYHRYQEVWLDK